MDRNCTNERNIYGESTRNARELTEAELDVVIGGFGINSLLAVCQAKTNSANEAAM